ncbi:MAG: multicopper oxidase family protein [Ardenticatenia bacterium]|nr:multicopper oxidase family protein [Ardenticatenia bacterium]
MSPQSLIPARAALLALPLLLAACQGATGLPSVRSSATATLPPIAVERAERSGAGAADIVYDASQMAELPCHSMAFTIMGRCTDDEVQLVAKEIRRRAAAEAPIGIIEASKLKDGAAGKGEVEDAKATAVDDAPTAEDDATPSDADPSDETGGDKGAADASPGRDLGDGIVYDAEAMAEFPCHAMGDTIMGRCNPDDLVRMKAELLDKRQQAEGRPTPLPDILPGDGPLGLAAMADSAMGGAKAATSGSRILVPVQAGRPVPLADGGHTAIRAQLARWTIDGVELPAYAYNGQIPGPHLQVRQGSTVEVAFENAIDMDTTIHWHGLRHANGSDGVPGVTQPAVAPGGRFTYRLSFPDPGLYWYHPHIREDIQQDAGLYGTILVTPARADYWAPADRETVLVLDDIRIEDGAAVGYGAEKANFAIMGRFGNTLLVNGKTGFQQVVDAGSVVRFYLVNVANVRPFRLSFDGAKMKKVGADLGRSKVEAWVDEVMLAPAERVIVEVAFDEARSYRIRHRSSQVSYDLGEVVALAQPKGPSLARQAWDRLRVDSTMSGDISRLKAYADLPPVMDLELTIDIPDLVTGERPSIGGSSDLSDPTASGPPADAHDDDAGHGPIEWEDEMLAVNRASDTAGVHWMIRDRASGAMNHDLAYTFRVGDTVRVRLRNLGDSVHPMQHPIHFHGQRLMVLSRNGETEHNPVWKDTIQTTPGETVELLMEITNPGAWMVHCHIAEHLEGGMMFQFQVLPADETTT